MRIYILVAIIAILLIIFYNYTYEYMCDYKVNLDLTFQTTKGTELKIYNNKKLVGTVKNLQSSKFKIPNFNYYDRLEFISINQGGKGGFIGEIKVNDGQIFYTNKNTFKLIGEKTNGGSELFPKYSGGKYLGCYRDTPDRTLPNMKKNINSISDCHNYAVNSQTPFYGVQAYGLCFTGYDYLQAKKISDYNCALKFPNNKNEYTGGIWANAVYSAIEAPDIVEFNDKERDKRRNISLKAKWIWVKGMGIHSQYTQGEWKFEWTLKPKKNRDFCGNPEFDDFIPTGCSNTKNKETCIKTVEEFYKNNDKICKNKINPMNQLRDGSLNIRIINCFDMIPTKDKTKIEHDFIDSLFSLYRISCKILEKCPNSYCSLLKLSENPKFKSDCKKLYIGDRICPDNIKAETQSCTPDSLECDYLETECKYNNYCWDKLTIKGPKCFLPKKNISEYIDFRDSKILSAIDAAGLYLNTKPINKNLKTEFKNKLIQLIKSIKLLEFSKSNNTTCECREGVKCYPC